MSDTTGVREKLTPDRASEPAKLTAVPYVDSNFAKTNI